MGLGPSPRHMLWQEFIVLKPRPTEDGQGGRTKEFIPAGTVQGRQARVNTDPERLVSSAIEDNETTRIVCDLTQIEHYGVDSTCRLLSARGQLWEIVGRQTLTDELRVLLCRSVDRE